MNYEQRKIAMKIAKSVRNRFGRKKAAELLDISMQNLSYIENMSTTLSVRNEDLFCASIKSCQNVIDWYVRTGGILD